MLCASAPTDTGFVQQLDPASRFGYVSGFSPEMCLYMAQTLVGQVPFFINSRSVELELGCNESPCGEISLKLHVNRLFHMSLDCRPKSNSIPRK